jgi:hypothetical protein
MGIRDLQPHGNPRSLLEEVHRLEPPAFCVMLREKVHDLSAVVSDRRGPVDSAAGDSEPPTVRSEQRLELGTATAVERGERLAQLLGSFAHPG